MNYVDKSSLDIDITVTDSSSEALDITVTDLYSESLDITVTDASSISNEYENQYTISAIADNGGGLAQITVSGGQSLLLTVNAGDRIYLTGTTDATLDNTTHEVSAVSSATVLVLTTAFNTAEITGTLILNPNHTIQDLTATDPSSQALDITVTDQSSIAEDITVTDPSSESLDITVTDNSSVDQDLTVTDNSSESLDITVTDLSSIEIDPKMYSVFWDFRESSSLLSKGKDGLYLIQNGTGSWNSSGYWSLNGSSSDYMSITNDLNSMFPPLPFLSHTWFELRFIFHINGTVPTGNIINGGAGLTNGFIVTDTGSMTYGYLLNSSIEFSAVTAEYGDTIADVRFFMYYDGTNTYVKIVDTEVDIIDSSKSGDLRQTSNTDNSTFGVNANIDRIYFIGWRHSDTLTNADFA